MQFVHDSINDEAHEYAVTHTRWSSLGNLIVKLPDFVTHAVLHEHVEIETLDSGQGEYYETYQVKRISLNEQFG